MVGRVIITQVNETMTSALTPREIRVSRRLGSIAATSKSTPNAPLKMTRGYHLRWAANIERISHMPSASATTAPAKAIQPPNQTSAITIGISTPADSSRWRNPASQPAWLCGAGVTRESSDTDLLIAMLLRHYATLLVRLASGLGLCSSQVSVEKSVPRGLRIRPIM